MKKRVLENINSLQVHLLNNLDEIFLQLFLLEIIWGVNFLCIYGYSQVVKL